MTSTLRKVSPLDNAYRHNSTHFIDVQGWDIPSHCGNPEKEKTQLKEGSVLVDWSHISKITIRGSDAVEAASQVDSRATSLKPLQCCASEDQAILRLTEDEFLILCQAGQEAKVLKVAKAPKTGVLNHGGGLGCLILAGQGRDVPVKSVDAC